MSDKRFPLFNDMEAPVEYLITKGLSLDAAWVVTALDVLGERVMSLTDYLEDRGGGSNGEEWKG